MTNKKHGLRGSHLEELINYTIELFRDNNIALIQKIPTPITPVEIDSKSRHITLAYFDKKSTVDYIGVVQGVPVCFDAKEVSVDTFPMINVHKHQIDFMEDFERQEGIAFFILHYVRKDEYYYVPFAEMKQFWDRALQGGRKSFTYDELDKSWIIESKNALLINFLPQLKRDLLKRDNQ